VRLIDLPSPPRALHFGCAPAGAPVEDDEVPVEDASVSPSDAMLGGTESESEGVGREPSVVSGKGSVSCSVHAGDVHNIGVVMATRSSVARRTSVASPSPLPNAGEMVNVMGHLGALQSTTASLVGRVVVV
jgi:hypothetical protein